MPTDPTFWFIICAWCLGGAALLTLGSFAARYLRAAGARRADERAEEARKQNAARAGANGMRSCASFQRRDLKK